MLTFVSFTLTSCATFDSPPPRSVLAQRSIQTRTFIATRQDAMNAVIVTLQDRNFIIDKVDDKMGIITATRLDGGRIRVSVFVKEQQKNVTVRMNAFDGTTPIEDGEEYQLFFAALGSNLQSKELF